MSFYYRRSARSALNCPTLFNYVVITSRVKSSNFSSYSSNLIPPPKTPLRVEFGASRLEINLQKEIRKLEKRVENNPESLRLYDLKNIILSRGFQINEDNPDTTSLTKQGTGSEKIKIEFEYRTRDETELTLFDVVISKSSDTSKFVFTCASSPKFLPLSIRIVPPDMSYLDQSVYDGPDTEKLSPKLLNELIGYLNERGIDERLARFIELHGYQKFLFQKCQSIKNTLDYIKS